MSKVGFIYKSLVRSSKLCRFEFFFSNFHIFVKNEKKNCILVRIIISLQEKKVPTITPRKKMQIISYCIGHRCHNCKELFK